MIFANEKFIIFRGNSTALVAHLQLENEERSREKTHTHTSSSNSGDDDDDTEWRCVWCHFSRIMHFKWKRSAEWECKHVKLHCIECAIYINLGAMLSLFLPQAVAWHEHDSKRRRTKREWKPKKKRNAPMEKESEKMVCVLVGHERTRKRWEHSWIGFSCKCACNRNFLMGRAWTARRQWCVINARHKVTGGKSHTLSHTEHTIALLNYYWRWSGP